MRDFGNTSRELLWHRKGLMLPNTPLPPDVTTRPHTLKVSSGVRHDIQPQPFFPTVEIVQDAWQVTGITLTDNKSCFKAGRTVVITGKALSKTTGVFIQNLPHTPRTPVSYSVISNTEIRFTVPFDQTPLPSGQNFMGVAVVGPSPDFEEVQASFPTDLRVGGEGIVVTASVSDYNFVGRAPFVNSDSGSLFSGWLRVDIDSSIPNTVFDMNYREGYFFRGSFIDALDFSWLTEFDVTADPDEWGFYPTVERVRILPRPFSINIDGQFFRFYGPAFITRLPTFKVYEAISLVNDPQVPIRYRAGKEIGGPQNQDEFEPFDVVFYTLLSYTNPVTRQAVTGYQKHTIPVTQYQAYNNLGGFVLHSITVPSIPPQVIACAD